MRPSSGCRTTTPDGNEGGQIEVGAGTKLDYETKTTYMVTVMAEDSFGDSASIMVTITVTDLNEGPDITGEDTIEYPENRTSSVETYRASDPERAGTITWSLDGTDAALFDISSNGVLTFKEVAQLRNAGGRRDTDSRSQCIRWSPSRPPTPTAEWAPSPLLLRSPT